MDEQQAAEDEPAFPVLKRGDAWRESVTIKRANELKALLSAWDLNPDRKYRGPFDAGVDYTIESRYIRRIKLTGADVFWLAVWGSGRLDEASPSESHYRMAAYSCP